MARDRFDDLDDTPDDDRGLDLVVEAPRPQRPPLNLRPLWLGALVLTLGGALGGAAYLLTAFDTRGLIALLDIGERPPSLSFTIPGLSPAPPPGGGGLLTPPGGAPERGAMLSDVAAAPPTPAAGTPPAASGGSAPAAGPSAGLPPSAATLPAAGPGGGPLPPAAPASANGRPTGAAAALAALPTPRPADKPPTFDSLPPPKGEVKALPAAPIREMLRRAPAGDLPAPAADGRLPWQAYARPWAGPADKGRAAVVIGGLGLDKAATEAVIAHAPPEVTLAFSPYAASLDKWIKKARDHGHEVLMIVPAERTDHPEIDPGPLGLTRGATPEANLARLEAVMARGPGAAGLLIPGPLAAAPQMPGLLAALRDRGLMVVAAGAPPADPALAYVAITEEADGDAFREAIDLGLNQVSIAARVRGRGLVVLPARPLALDRLLAWVADLGAQGVVLAPASALAAPPAKKEKS